MKALEAAGAGAGGALSKKLNALNPTVTGTADLPDMRSEVAMAKETADTRPIIEPDETGADAERSTDVCTKTATAPAVAAPIVKPLQCSA